MSESSAPCYIRQPVSSRNPDAFYSPRQLRTAFLKHILYLFQLLEVVFLVNRPQATGAAEEALQPFQALEAAVEGVEVVRSCWLVLPFNPRRVVHISR